MIHLLTTILVALRLLVALAVPIETETIHHHHPAPIQEDSAEWDCQTMGNLICGEWDEASQTYLLVDYGKGEGE